MDHHDFELQARKQLVRVRALAVRCGAFVTCSGLLARSNRLRSFEAEECIFCRRNRHFTRLAFRLCYTRSRPAERAHTCLQLVRCYFGLASSFIPNMPRKLFAADTATAEQAG